MQRISACSEGLVQSPENRQLHLTRAYLYMRKHDYAKARSDIQAVPPNSDSHLLLGMIYKVEKQAHAAMAEFNQGIALATAETPATLLAELYLERAETQNTLNHLEAYRQDLDQAIAIFTAAQPRSPRLRQALYLRTEYWKKQNNTHKALEDLSQLIRLAPRNLPFYTDRIALALKIKAFDQALEDYQLLHQLDPEDPWYLLGQGEMRIYLNQYDRAEKDFLAVQEYDPPPEYLPLAHFQLAWLYALQADYPRAEAKLNQVRADPLPTMTPYLFYAGWIAHLKGDQKTAQSHLLAYLAQSQSGDTNLGEDAQWLDFNQKALLKNRSLTLAQTELWQQYLEKAQKNDLPALEALIKLLVSGQL